jgi:hypothetical protein
VGVPVKGRDAATSPRLIYEVGHRDVPSENMIKSIIAKFVGTKHDRDMKALQPLVDEINSFEAKIKSLTDDQLKAKTPELKGRVA